MEEDVADGYFVLSPLRLCCLCYHLIDLIHRICVFFDPDSVTCRGEETYELDEDDYDLLQEANVTGFHRPPKAVRSVSYN